MTFVTDAQQRIADALRARFPNADLDFVEVARIAICAMHRRGERHGRAKLTEKQVAEIRAKRAQRTTLAALSAEYGVTESVVSKICRGETWRWTLPPLI
jgi:hypothetical protein